MSKGVNCGLCPHENACCSRYDFPDVKLNILEKEADAYGRHLLVATEIPGVYTNRTQGCAHKKGGRCSIWKDRPMECHLYPLIVNPEEPEQILLDPFCRRISNMLMEIMAGEPEQLQWIQEMLAWAQSEPDYLRAQAAKLEALGDTHLHVKVPVDVLDCLPEGRPRAMDAETLEESEKLLTRSEEGIRDAINGLPPQALDTMYVESWASTKREIDGNA